MLTDGLECCGLLWCFYQTLILTAPIHCRASIAETLMQRHISTNLMKKLTFNKIHSNFSTTGSRYHISKFVIKKAKMCVNTVRKINLFCLWMNMISLKPPADICSCCNHTLTSFWWVSQVIRLLVLCCFASQCILI